MCKLREYILKIKKSLDTKFIIKIWNCLNVTIAAFGKHELVTVGVAVPDHREVTGPYR